MLEAVIGLAVGAGLTWVGMQARVSRLEEEKRYWRQKCLEAMTDKI